MDPETLTVLNGEMYRGVMMVLEAALLIVGGTSMLFLIFYLVGAVCGYFAEQRQPRAAR